MRLGLVDKHQLIKEHWSLHYNQQNRTQKGASRVSRPEGDRHTLQAPPREQLEGNSVGLTTQRRRYPLDVKDNVQIRYTLGTALAPHPFPGGTDFTARC